MLRPRRLRPSPLGPVVPLEDRTAPANLRLTGVTLTDGNLVAQPNPVYGQKVVARANWASQAMTGTELAVPARFTASFPADYFSPGSAAVAMPLDTPTVGHGTGGGNWFYYRSGWYAGTAPFTLTVTVDPNNQIAETDETDNTIVLTITPVAPADLPSKFAQPVGASPNARDWSITNYADVDPRAGPRLDYRGGGFQYDGHDAIDAGPQGFSRQDAGIPVYATAAGTVSGVDGGSFFDRENSTNGGQNWNAVYLDHGSNWSTEYGHLAAGSITVKPGDRVAAGQVLGLMASSGFSTGTHTHYTAFYRGSQVEVGFAPATYWQAPLPYAGDAPSVIREVGVTNFSPTAVADELAERPAQYTEVGAAAPGTAVMSFYLTGRNLKATDTLYFQWVKPDGSVLNTSSFSPNGNYLYESVWWWNRPQSVFQGTPGTWQVVYYLNGTAPANEQRRAGFTVVAGLDGGNLRATDVTSGRTLIDGRTTPVDFGSVPAGGAAVTRSFVVANTAYGPLALSNFQLPPGFSLVSAPASVAAGGSGIITVRLDPSVVGAKAGSLTFDTTDLDVGRFELALAGAVTGTAPAAAPVVTLPGPAAAYNRGAVPRLLSPTATVVDGTNDLGGGTLRVEFASFGDAADRLAVRHQGTAAGQIGVSGAAVTFGGAALGTVAGGVGTAPLVVTLAAGATPAGVQALARALTYQNVAAAATTQRKAVRYTLTDAAGNVSNLATQVVVNTGVSRDPVAAALPAATVVRGTTLTQPGTFTDAWGQSWTATADYGDGAGPQPLALTGTAYTLSRLLTLPPGAYTVTVRVVNDQGGQATATQAVTIVPPAVAAVAVNGGAAQRSRVTGLGVTFNAVVTAQAGAFTLRRTGLPGGGAGDNLLVTAAATLQTVGGRTVATLAFPAQPGVEFGSLADGSWTLVVAAAGVATAEGGVPLPADATQPGLRRLYGDGNGDGTVDGADFLDFVNGFGLAAGDVGFAPGFDSNGDELVDGADFLELVNRFGVSV